MRRIDNWLFGVIALVFAFFITHGLIAQPAYTDAYYYFNAATRFAAGDGLTDEYLFTYIGAPDSLPAPSHLYWMPFTSIVAGAAMWVANAPGNYDVAQIPFALMFAATAGVGFWLGGQLGGTRRHAWVAGLMTLFSGFFTRFWGMTDTFAPFAFVGSLTLVFIGLGVTRGRTIFWLAAGIFAGFGHLTRADGMLLIIVGYVVIGWVGISQGRHIKPMRAVLTLTIGYLIAMIPWFVRNLHVIGTPLPLGGAQAIWFITYDDLFRYPPHISPSEMTLQTFVDSRWLALSNNFLTFLAVEGMVVVAPLMLIGLWRRRRDHFLTAFWIYALGLHLAMTLAFPFAGYRGGLFHSAAALIPFWMALGGVGLDDAVHWVAARRRNWKPHTAKRVFSVGLVILAMLLSLNVGLQGRVTEHRPALFDAVMQYVPINARVLVNDPAELYYYTGRGGVVLPNAPVEVLQQVANQYDVDYFLFQGENSLTTQLYTSFDPDNLPPFLTLITADLPGARLYAINH